jgi:putative autoinducer-2 (AI-2) aldolase
LRTQARSGNSDPLDAEESPVPEADARDDKQFHADVPQKTEGFFLKGSNALDWGLKNRLSKIFDPTSGRTVMLAIDHGYFQGPTTGLERVDLNIVPLLPWSDTLMCTRGILRSVIPPTYGKGIVIRASGGPSILKELSNEEIAISIDEAVRLNVAAMAVQVFVGGEGETKSVHNLTRLVDMGNSSGIATLAVTAVGRELVRDAKYLGLATRICAELGATYVKTYFCDEGFEKVTAGCPIPIVIAGGKKLPEKEALEMAYQAIQQGASGVDMGRNIFQSDAPAAMLQAVRKVVHENEKPEIAFQYYRDLANRS